jgi:hypothetical protein
MAPPMLRIQKLITPPGGHFLLANFSQKFDQKLPRLNTSFHSQTFHKSLMAPPMLRIQKLITPPEGQFLLDFL